jgi:metal-responsive CopG/Arc/MetJ family transcriptional regulator
MRGDEGRSSVVVPIALARWIDEVIEKAGNPKLSNRNSVAREAGRRLIRKYSLETRPIKPKWRFRRATLNMASSQRSLIQSAVQAEIMPFITADEAYRNEIMEILKGLGRRTRKG